MPWHTPITENPGPGDTEIWEIYNATGDAHPVHVHLVHFEVINRQRFKAKSIEQPVLQHNGTYGVGFRLEKLKTIGKPSAPDASEQTRRDMVMALPGEVTRIKMTFDKPGRYVWHCHILSHEDHEMMRPFHVGPGPF
jgi:spore coat protein A